MATTWVVRMDQSEETKLIQVQIEPGWPRPDDVVPCIEMAQADLTNNKFQQGRLAISVPSTPAASRYTNSITDSQLDAVIVAKLAVAD